MFSGYCNYFHFCLAFLFSQTSINSKPLAHLIEIALYMPLVKSMLKFTCHCLDL
ncbi:hypothetical protein RchiOBHm_Chr1g0351581 [Rosa chinensis]|uniref:Uncharacterized protein n=1 Tax=Rosa chinensis TaxID=74649 RepID=A0A2P6SGC6_ROSCH|nr:hypothetical protein RchiOBHm_Chr1g0351581 [Rosa chinensis]